MTRNRSAPAPRPHPAVAAVLNHTLRVLRRYGDIDAALDVDPLYEDLFLLASRLGLFEAINVVGITESATIEEELE